MIERIKEWLKGMLPWWAVQSERVERLHRTFERGRKQGHQERDERHGIAYRQAYQQGYEDHRAEANYFAKRPDEAPAAWKAMDRREPCEDVRIDRVKDAVRACSEELSECMPDGPRADAALQRLREARLWALDAIVTEDEEP